VTYETRTSSAPTSDTAAKIEAFLPTVERMVGEGLIAISDVEVIRYAPQGPRVRSLMPRAERPRKPG